MDTAWYHFDSTQVLEKLQTSRRGLTAIEVAARMAAHGANVLPEERAPGPLALILRQLTSSLVYILLAAAAVSFGLRDFLDAQVILAAVILNVLVGFFQERRAQKTLEQLRRVVHFQALVIREGAELLVPAETIVPGDILVLKTGSRIPADGRIFQTADLTVNEAALTGESYPVPKIVKRFEGAVLLAEQSNMVFLGTTVAQGGGLAVVTATGLATEIGKIAVQLRDMEEDPTPLQARLRVFSRLLGTAILCIALALFLLGVLVGKPLTEIFTVSVAVAVAAIPEGLLVAVTVILTIGMRAILRQHALVRTLVAAETLGSTTVICTDKTGTLTEGEMSVVRIITESDDLGFDGRAQTESFEKNDSASTRAALKIGLLCNDAHIEHEDQPLEHRLVVGNPTERALIFAAHAAGLTRHALEKDYPRLDAIPFDSERKYMVTLHRRPSGGNLVLIKGAPEKVLGACTSFDRDGAHHVLTEERRDQLLRMSDRMSREGLRVIAFAHRHVEKNIDTIVALPDPFANAIFVGLLAMKDPLRAGAADTIRLCRRAGIRIVMITGDHKLTAQTIARELGLPAENENILTGEELGAMADYELEKRISSVSVYARVTPKDKLHIIDAWQARGEVVAMTGDGVNDAPALRSANIGVALGSGTDVAQQAADVVLLDNNFRTIVAAVERGRVIYENIRKVVLYLLTDSFSEVIVIALALFASIVMADFPLPLLAAQILWINLVTDGLPNIALTLEPEEPEIMNEPPRDPKQDLMTGEMKWLVGTVSVVSAFAAFAAFLYYWKVVEDLVLARTVVFAALGIDSLFYVFSIRNLRHSLFRVSPFTNRPLLFAVAGGFLIQIVAIYAGPLQRILGTAPLGVNEWSMVAVAVVLVIASVEIVKAVFRSRQQTSLS